MCKKINTISLGKIRGWEWVGQIAFLGFHLPICEMKEMKWREVCLNFSGFKSYISTGESYVTPGREWYRVGHTHKHLERDEEKDWECA